MTQIAVFSSQQSKNKTATGKNQYIFSQKYRAPNNSDTVSSQVTPPLAFEGDIFSYESPVVTEQLPFDPKDSQIIALTQTILQQWLTDCQKAFVRPPTLEQCLANVRHVVQDCGHIAVIEPEEEGNEWQALWVPSLITVEIPHFEIAWTPAFKRENTRITEDMEVVTNDLQSVEIHQPEKTYTIMPSTTRREDDNALEEVTDFQAPLVDGTTLRLDMGLHEQREKMRRKVRDSRIRAKLAHQRAERIARRFEEKFGEQPEEEADEAETEYETDVD